MKTSLKIVLTFAAAAGSLAAMSAPAVASEGHWSIGKGIQCHLSGGVVVCSSTRP